MIAGNQKVQKIPQLNHFIKLELIEDYRNQKDLKIRMLR